MQRDDPEMAASLGQLAVLHMGCERKWSRSSRVEAGRSVAGIDGMFITVSARR